MKNAFVLSLCAMLCATLLSGCGSSARRIDPTTQARRCTGPWAEDPKTGL